MIRDITIERVGTGDDVNVTGFVNGVAITIHVWYSHLYGENTGSLNGNKKAIKVFIQETLQAEYDRMQVTAIEL